MKKFVLIISLFLMIVLSSCAKKDNEKKPFGAENIDYQKIQGVNNDGPSLASEHAENRPPMADKTVNEIGPMHEISLDKVEPTAESDDYVSYDAVPIFEPGHKD